MVGRHLPKVEQKIHNLGEEQAHHEDIARRAQTGEETAGDISYACEKVTYRFTRRYWRLRHTHRLMMSLHRQGALDPQLLDTLLRYFKVFYDHEVANVKKYKSSLAIEKFLDNLFNHHSDLASDLQNRRLTLIRSRPK